VPLNEDYQDLLKFYNKMLCICGHKKRFENGSFCEGPAKLMLHQVWFQCRILMLSALRVC